MGELIFRKFRNGDEVPFRILNEAWVKKYFRMEAADHEVLGDPVGQVITPGGEIVIAELDGEVVGCCGLVRMDGGVFEVAKMTVGEQWRGTGIGEKLLRAAVARAGARGATGLYLETNSALGPAIRLYERVGFRHVPPERRHASPYARSDVQMEMELTRDPIPDNATTVPGLT